jgi:hypothetical protein
MLFSQAFEHRDFTERESSFGKPTIPMFALVAVSEDRRCRRDDAKPRSASAAASMTIRNAYLIRHRLRSRLSESSFTGSPAELCLRWRDANEITRISEIVEGQRGNFYANRMGSGSTAS